MPRYSHSRTIAIGPRLLRALLALGVALISTAALLIGWFLFFSVVPRELSLTGLHFAKALLIVLDDEAAIASPGAVLIGDGELLCLAENSVWEENCSAPDPVRKYREGELEVEEIRRVPLEEKREPILLTFSQEVEAVLHDATQASEPVLQRMQVRKLEVLTGGIQIVLRQPPASSSRFYPVFLDLVPAPGQLTVHLTPHEALLTQSDVDESSGMRVSFDPRLGTHLAATTVISHTGTSIYFIGGGRVTDIDTTQPLTLPVLASLELHGRVPDSSLRLEAVGANWASLRLPARGRLFASTSQATVIDPFGSLGLGRDTIELSGNPRWLLASFGRPALLSFGPAAPNDTRPFVFNGPAQSLRVGGEQLIKSRWATWAPEIQGAVVAAALGVVVTLLTFMLRRILATANQPPLGYLIVELSTGGIVAGKPVRPPSAPSETLLLRDCYEYKGGWRYTRTQTEINRSNVVRSFRRTKGVQI